MARQPACGLLPCTCRCPGTNTWTGTAFRSVIRMLKKAGRKRITRRYTLRERQRRNAICRACLHPKLITRLVSVGVRFAPLILHTGVASLEKNEPPYEEYYRIPHTTAELVNTARAGHRIIAVGTTSVRFGKTMSDLHGVLYREKGGRIYLSCRS